MLFDWTKWDKKSANFQGNPLIQDMYNIITEKQTFNSTYLVSVRCGGWWNKKGTRLTDMMKDR